MCDVDSTDVEIKCMHKIGRNRFCCPLLPDVCWYDYDHVIAIIPEPTKVTERHYQIYPDIWKKIEEHVKYI